MMILTQNIMAFLFLLISLNAITQDEWKLHKVQDNSTLWTKNLNNSRLLQFKLETTANNNLEEIYNIILDVENMSKWYDKVKSVKLLKRNSDTEAIYLLEYGIPLPFENRVSTVKGNMFFDRKNGIIKVNTAYHPYQLSGSVSKMPLITILKSTWEITSLKSGGIKIVHSGYMDPGGNIPVWLTNEGVTSGPFKTIRNLKKLLKAS